LPSRPDDSRNEHTCKNWAIDPYPPKIEAKNLTEYDFLGDDENHGEPRQKEDGDGQ
jgi:hypothetical protein